MNDTDAAGRLQELIDQASQLRQVGAFSHDHTKWIARTIAYLEEVFGPESYYYSTFARYRWTHPGEYIFGGIGDVEGSRNPAAAIKRIDHEAYLQQVESAQGLLAAALDDLERHGVAGVYRSADFGVESSTLLRVIDLAERKLRKTLREAPIDERTIQDKFEDLLNGADIPFSREAVHIEYSSKTYVPDFTIDKLALAIDLKLCSAPQHEKRIIAEINDDLQAYRSKYDNLLFIVYDAGGHIRDVERFAESFRADTVAVIVVKH